MTRGFPHPGDFQQDDAISRADADTSRLEAIAKGHHLAALRNRPLPSTSLSRARAAVLALLPWAEWVSGKLETPVAIAKAEAAISAGNSVWNEGPEGKD